MSGTQKQFSPCQPPLPTGDASQLRRKMIFSPTGRLSLIFVILVSLNCNGDVVNTSTATGLKETKVRTGDDSLRVEPGTGLARNWSVQLGVAIISQNNMGEILSEGYERAEGEAGGQLYSLTFNWVAHRFEIPCQGRILTPQFEPYLTFTLVDENGRSVFPDYNGGVGFRWVDFPWNRWVKTTFFMGIGLSYSSHVYTIDRLRHFGEERSHLKFDWPIQFTFALPRWPQHQLVLFNDHQSGGHIFDEGGVNSFGVGYRLEF